MADNDLEVLFPDGKTVTVAGEGITVKPFTFGQIPKVVGTVKKLAGVVQGDQIDVLDAIEKGGEDLLALAAFVVGKPRAWFDAVPTDEGVELLKAIFEVNLDFFAKRVRPLLPTFLFPSDESSPDGEASQPDSSATATTGKPSKATR